MVTYTPTSTNVKSQVEASPSLKGAYTAICIVAIVSAGVVVQGRASSDFKKPICVSTVHATSSDYNRSINFSLDGASMRLTRLEESLARLIEIGELQDNWNDNGAAPFSTEIVELAKKIVLGLSVQPTILPTSRDSIQMEYEKENGDYLEFELFAGGRLKMFMSMHDGVSETKDIDLSVANKVVCDFYG